MDLSETVVGISGTREGLTQEQINWYLKFISQGAPAAVRHGCCVGADSDIHWITLMWSEHTVIYVHQPNDLSRADEHCLTADNGRIVVMSPAPYLERNRDIVDSSDVLVAFPKEFEDPGSGGTWYTIRYALAQNRDVFIVYPDGTEELRAA